ncbi:hypothetical protein Esti_003693 [Eimeria stiedai]
MGGRRLLYSKPLSSVRGRQLLCITWTAAALLLPAKGAANGLALPLEGSEPSSNRLTPPLPYSYLQLSVAAGAPASPVGEGRAPSSPGGDSAAAAEDNAASAAEKQHTQRPQGLRPAFRQESDDDVPEPSPSPPEVDGHDVLLDFLGEDPQGAEVRGVPLEELHGDLDPLVLKLEEHIFGKATKPEKGGPSPTSDLMEASLDLGRLARGLDLGEKAAEVDNGDLQLFESLPAEQTPEALRGLISLEGQELLGGHLLRLWGAHRRLGLSLHEAMAAFVASIEREKARDAAVAAVMEVYKARQGVEAAEQEKQKVAEAGAELQMLLQQHKYLGKQRRLLRNSLKQAAADPANLSTLIEDMWAPVDASAALDPARGSNFYNAVKLLGEDAQRTASTCAKLLLLVGHITKEGKAATKQQLEKEAEEEEELRLVLNPETGPLAALSSPSLSTLSRKNPKALREADEEFMRQGDAAGSGRLQQHQPFVLLRSGLSQQQQLPPSGATHPRSASGRVGIHDGLQDDSLPLGPAEFFFRLPLSSPQRQQQGDALQAPTVAPSVVYDVELPAGDLSFFELQAEVGKLASSSAPQEQQPHPQQHTSQLKPVAPHDAASYSPESSFLTLTDKSEKEDEKEEEEEETEGSAQESAAEKESHSNESEGEETNKQQQHKGSKQQKEEQEADKEPEGSHEEGSAGESSTTASSTEASAAAAEAAAATPAAAAAATAHESPSISMLRDLGPESCESITGPAACMQRENCFQDFIYGACFFNCTTVETPEDCEKHTFCRYEKHVPHNACVNEGYQTTDAVVQKFEGILRGCEHFTKKETCDWMYQHGQRLAEAEKQQKQHTAAGDKISATAHLGPSPYHCQWMSGAAEGAGDKGDKKEGGHEDLGGSSVCGNLKDAPTAERLLWGTIIAEKEKKLRELKTTEHVEQEDVCVRPSDRLAVLQPNRPFYSVGSVVKFSCLPGSVLLGVSDEIECKADGTFVPALSCVEESDLSPTQLQHLRRKTAAVYASAGASAFGGCMN